MAVNQISDRCLCEYNELSHTVERKYSELGVLYHLHVMRLFCQKCGNEVLVRTSDPDGWYKDRERRIGVYGSHLHLLGLGLVPGADDVVAEMVIAIGLAYYEGRLTTVESVREMVKLGFPEDKVRDYESSVAAEVLARGVEALHSGVGGVR